MKDRLVKTEGDKEHPLIVELGTEPNPAPKKANEPQAGLSESENEDVENEDVVMEETEAEQDIAAIAYNKAAAKWTREDIIRLAGLDTAVAAANAAAATVAVLDKDEPAWVKKNRAAEEAKEKAKEGGTASAGAGTAGPLTGGVSEEPETEVKVEGTDTKKEEDAVTPPAGGPIARAGEGSAAAAAPDSEFTKLLKRKGTKADKRRAKERVELEAIESALAEHQTLVKADAEKALAAASKKALSRKGVITAWNASMSLYGTDGPSAWGRLDPSGAVWCRLGPSGAVWSRVRPFGAVWGRLGPSV